MSSEHPPAALLEVTRGGHRESIHYGAVAVVDAAGRLVAYAGDPEQVTYLRSSAKPFQLLPLVEAGGVARFGFSDQEVAVMAASHAGEPRHVETVQGILNKIGLDENALRCGAHWPSSDVSTRRLREAGQEPTAIYNNCSGKHAGMLAQAVQRGLSTDDYLEPHHPIQITILNTLAALSGVEAGAIHLGTDGCSVPCFALPLRAGALAFARLVDSAALPEPRRGAVQHVVEAMTTHPEMVAGEVQFDTALMRAARGSVLSKGGAEGYLGLALRARGLGVAVKIADGNGPRAGALVAIEVLRQLDALDGEALDRLNEPGRRTIKNHRGLTVGELRPVFQLHTV